MAVEIPLEDLPLETCLKTLHDGSQGESGLHMLDEVSVDIGKLQVLSAYE
jgi:hypothetical protein